MAGFKQFRLHDLRHTYAVIRIRKGDNLADVSKKLGHASIKMTVDKYYRWIPDQDPKQIDELDSLIE
jgi:integrase